MTIHRKTPQGLTEIETRALRLPPRLRMLLILVDGKRSLADLAPLVGGDPAPMIEALLAAGVIEPTGETGVSPAALPSHTAAPTPAPVASAPSFEQHRREAVRHLTEQIGPVAEALALKIEKARDWAQLLPILQIATQVLGNTRGQRVAAAFEQRFVLNPPNADR